MARTKDHKDDPTGVGGKREREEMTYRGRKIEIVREGLTSAKGGQPVRPRLYIDGQEVDVEETGTGVMSSQNIFAEYGSIHELAEDIIRQWGQAPVRSVEGGAHKHGHEHGTNSPSPRENDTTE